MKLHFSSRDELRNGLPESAQGFLIFGPAKYCNAASCSNDDLLNSDGNILKTSGLNAGGRAATILLTTASLATFGVSCAK